jgi:hypothetical protein
VLRKFLDKQNSFKLLIGNKIMNLAIPIQVY